MPLPANLVNLTSLERAELAAEPGYCGACSAELTGCARCRRPMGRGEPVGCPMLTEPRCDRCDSGGELGYRCGVTSGWRDVMRGVRAPVLCGGTIVPTQVYAAHGHPACVRRR